MNSQNSSQTIPNKPNPLKCPLDSKCYFSFACSSICNKKKNYKPGLLSFKKGDVLFKAMGNEESTFIILSGVASAISHLPSGEVVTICLLGKSYTIGEIEPFFTQKIYYVIQALTPMTVCQIRTHDLVYLVDENPSLLKQVISAVENNSHAFARQLWVMNAQRVHERIKRFLSVFIKMSGNNHAEPLVCLSHDELAVLINTDRPSVTRALHKLEEEGFVKLGYKKLKVIGHLPTEDLDLNLNFRFDPLSRNISLLENGHTIK